MKPDSVRPRNPTARFETDSFPANTTLGVAEKRFCHFRIRTVVVCLDAPSSSAAAWIPVLLVRDAELLPSVQLVRPVAAIRGEEEYHKIHQGVRQTDRQTVRQTDRQTDRHHTFTCSSASDDRCIAHPTLPSAMAGGSTCDRYLCPCNCCGTRPVVVSCRVP
jgi:hypothetical protein